MKNIEINNDKCIGCMACLLACSLVKTKAFSYESAVMKIAKDEATELCQLYTCSNCDDRKCIEVCPFDAINMDNNYGIPIIDYDKCISCGLCAKNCNYGIIKTESESKRIYKCDLCNGSPACVLSCVSGAIKICNTDI